MGKMAKFLYLFVFFGGSAWGQEGYRYEKPQTPSGHSTTSGFSTQGDAGQSPIAPTGSQGYPSGVTPPGSVHQGPQTYPGTTSLGTFPGSENNFPTGQPSAPSASPTDRPGYSPLTQKPGVPQGAYSPGSGAPVTGPGSAPGFGPGTNAFPTGRPQQEQYGEGHFGGLTSPPGESTSPVAPGLPEPSAPSGQFPIPAAFPGHPGGFDDGSYEGGDYSAIPGEPGIDYPIYSEIPLTSFRCEQQPLLGYYADVETRCQGFHVCANNRTFDFLCPNGTVFHQEYFVCVWWNQFECETAPSLYGLNEKLYDYSIVGRFPPVRGPEGLPGVIGPQISTGQFPQEQDGQPGQYQGSGPQLPPSSQGYPEQGPDNLPSPPGAFPQAPSGRPSGYPGRPSGFLSPQRPSGSSEINAPTVTQIPSGEFGLGISKPGEPFQQHTEKNEDQLPATGYPGAPHQPPTGPNGFSESYPGQTGPQRPNIGYPSPAGSEQAGRPQGGGPSIGPSTDFHHQTSPQGPSAGYPQQARPQGPLLEYPVPGGQLPGSGLPGPDITQEGFQGQVEGFPSTEPTYTAPQGHPQVDKPQSQSGYQKPSRPEGLLNGYPTPGNNQRPVFQEQPLAPPAGHSNGYSQPGRPQGLVLEYPGSGGNQGPGVLEHGPGYSGQVQPQGGIQGPSGVFQEGPRDPSTGYLGPGLQEPNNGHPASGHSQGFNGHSEIPAGQGETFHPQQPSERPQKLPTAFPQEGGLHRPGYQGPENGYQGIAQGPSEGYPKPELQGRPDVFPEQKNPEVGIPPFPASFPGSRPQVSGTIEQHGGGYQIEHPQRRPQVPETQAPIQRPGGTQDLPQVYPSVDIPQTPTGGILQEKPFNTLPEPGLSSTFPSSIGPHDQERPHSESGRPGQSPATSGKQPNREYLPPYKR